MTEQWRPVLDYEGLYEVSDQGRVRSLTRQVLCPDGAYRTWHGRLMTAQPDNQGRLQVRLNRDRQSRVRRVHRLVLESFIGPRPNGLEGCHNDGNCQNNSLSNLRWDTRSSNMLDSVAHGTHIEARKTHCPRGHAYAGENLVLNSRPGKQWRSCLECRRAAQRERSRRAYVAHPRPPLLSADDRLRMVAMRASGLKIREIAPVFGISTSATSRVLQQESAEALGRTA